MKRKIKGDFRSESKSEKLNAAQARDDMAAHKPSRTAELAFKRPAYPRRGAEWTR